jgi:ribulose-5-phosphate 4-epimerase/fuculose-1-phosphate aldolase
MLENSLEDVLDDVAAANRILAQQGVLDSFGHVSARHPHKPGHYLVSWAKSPATVTRADVVEITHAGDPVAPDGRRLYAERVIHGAIYAARPDVMAVCHHHAPGVMPFASSGVAIEPMFHVGAVIGAHVPMWDSRDEFGDTSLLVTTAEQGASLARALGPHWSVIMRRHGATVVGRSLREAVFRCVALNQNGDIQQKAIALGGASPLTSAEIELAAAANLSSHVIARAWDNWQSTV